MGVYASPQDIAGRWPGYSADEHDARAEKLIGDAEALMLDRIPALPARIANGVVSERTVTVVVSDMTTRVLRNPEGYRSEDDGDYRYVYAPGAYTPGEVGMTRSDLSRLNGPRRGATGPGDDDALRNLTRSPGGQLVQDRGLVWRSR